MPNQKSTTQNSNFFFWNKIEPILQQHQPNNKILTICNEQGWITCYSPFCKTTEPMFIIKPDRRGQKGEFFDMQTSKRGTLRELCHLMGVCDSTEHTSESIFDDFSEEVSSGSLFQTFSEMDHSKEIEWLVEGILCKENLAMIFGPPETAKTFLALDLTINLLSGHSWAGTHKISHSLEKIVYCTSEGAINIKRRLNSACAAKGLDPSLLENKFLFCPEDIQLFLEDDPLFIRKVMDNYKQHHGNNLDLLIIDTLSNASRGANENLSSDTNHIVYQLNQIRKDFGCAILLIHHTTKEKRFERGSSVYRGACDVMLEVSKHKNHYLMNCSKLKEGPHFQTVPFSLIPQGKSCYVAWKVVQEESGDKRQTETKERILQLIFQNPKISALQLSELLGLSKVAVCKQVSPLINEGIVFTAKGSRNTILYYLAESKDQLLDTLFPVSDHQPIHKK